MARLTSGIVALAIILTACGGSSPPASSASAISSVSGSASGKPGAVSPVASGGALTKITFSYSAITASQSPSYIALDDGLFEKYGLKADLRFLASSPTTVTAMLAGEIDAALAGGDGVVSARVAGSPIVYISLIKTALTGRLMAKPGIDKVSQIKTISVSRIGGNGHYLALRALERSGVDPKTVTFSQSGSNENDVLALASRQVDASALIPPGDLLAERQGAHELVDVTAMKLPYPAIGIVVTEATLEKRPNVVRQVLQAVGAGVHVYMTNPSHAQAVVKKWTKLDDDAVVKAAYESEKQVMEPEMAIRPEAIAAVLQDLAATDPRAKPFKPEQFYDDRPLKALTDSGFFARLS